MPKRITRNRGQRNIMMWLYRHVLDKNLTSFFHPNLILARDYLIDTPFFLLRHLHYEAPLGLEASLKPIFH